ncbi:hypothetical protein GFY24_36870 [Nocardia sp. SYP-A9097]|uniref:hypothetical protein n=1 Tax=Nocardia sp. SYP-A9097 TaxID=2663237 RepID=UPI00129BC7AC|nr:hypothetical protein [Nocardia sp. SYP-A9097]MRH92930.1 hypothetical protein [Nocardia sp. SYP-A9097]
MSTDLTETVAAQRDRYCEENGFTGAHIDRYNQIILRAGLVDAIQMPAVLGDRVRVELSRQLLTTPIIENRLTGALTVLTQAASAEDTRSIFLFSKLYRVQAIRTPKGALIMLPGPADKMRVWLDSPVSTLRPPFEKAVAITLDSANSLPRVVN